MKRTILTGMCLLMMQITAFSQSKSVPFDKSAFGKDQKKELKIAFVAYTYGNDLVDVDENFDEALKQYEIAYAFNPNNADLNFKMGMCHLFGHGLDKHDALPYFAKAEELDINVSPDLPFFYGMALHSLAEWDKAIEQYELAKKGADQYRIDEAEMGIEQCKYGINYQNNPERVFIDPVEGIDINTDAVDFGPVINADESIMMFSSRRSVEPKEPLDVDGMPFEDIYVTYRTGPNYWTGTKNMGKNVNTEVHDAVVGLSPDGTRLFIYKEGDLYECDEEGGEWTKPKKLGKTINTKDKETSASLSSDGKKLYFVSDRQDISLGGLDIYVSDLQPDGSWGEPQNLGPTINTSYNEEGVFMHPDGKTLYFSSEAHTSMGGYDIFRSTLENGQWTTPVNLGWPINSPGEDVFFVVNASGRHGYYASVKKGGKGSQDIYRITMLGPEKPLMYSTEDQLLASVNVTILDVAPEPKVEISGNELTLFKGIVVDDETSVPLKSQIMITDNEAAELISESESQEGSGKFLLTLPSGKNYGIAVEAKGYLFHSENFDLPKGGDYQIVEKEIRLQKIEIGKKIVLKNIFYDFDKATLRPESKVELDNLSKLLNDNPTLKVEMGAHTDSRGSDAYNQELSERRAQSVVDYLINAGLSKDRLVPKGYGESEPIATNATDEGRQENRRTEFKILSI